MRPSKFVEADVVEALEKTAGNITYAAEILGVTRMHVSRLVKRYALAEAAQEMRGVMKGRPSKTESLESLSPLLPDVAATSTATDPPFPPPL